MLKQLEQIVRGKERLEQMIQQVSAGQRAVESLIEKELDLEQMTKTSDQREELVDLVRASDGKGEGREKV